MEISTTRLTPTAPVSTPAASASASAAADSATPAALPAAREDEVALSSAADHDREGSGPAPSSSTSPTKAFTYGTLGLENPDDPDRHHNSFYTAGRMATAAVTAGALLSLVI